METKQRIFPAPRALYRAGAFALPLLPISLFYLLRTNQTAMSGWVFGIIGPLEQLLGRLWSIFPFSVGEYMLGLFLLGCLLWVVRICVLLWKEWKAVPCLRRLAALVSAWLWVWAGLCWLWNAAYYAPTFTQRAGLELTPYSVEELARVTEYFAQNAAQLAEQMPRDAGGHFEVSLHDCFDRGVDIYENLSSEFPCLTMKSVKAKPLLCSPLQSRLGFTGVYSPITGEANVNVDAPACTVPATIAHEMAHQRMVASEQECNFLGIAACTSCDDIVFQYSGYFMGLIHLCNALYSVAPDTWYDIAGRTFTQELSQDWRDNNDYWAALSSPAEDTAQEVYDSFLKNNDQTLGIRSYGACVDLLVVYFG